MADLLPDSVASAASAPVSLRSRFARQQAALIELGRAWREHEHDVPRALAAITETAVAAVDVERASVWLLDAARTHLVCRDLYTRTPRTHEHGHTLDLARFPAYLAAIEAAELLAAGDAHHEPPTSELRDAYLRPLGIGALLDAPIRLGGAFVGVLCHEHVGGPRAWTLDDQNAAAYLATLASLALEVERRQATEARLARSLSLLRATFEATEEGILGVDRQGSVVAYNRRFVELWGIDEELLGPAGDGGARLRFLAERTVAPEAYQERALEVFREPARESLDTIELADGRVFERSSRPQREGDEVIGRVWSFRDVTRQKQIEEALREAEQRQRELATTDALTGLMNRRVVLEQARQEAARAARTQRPTSVVMLDVDRFKRINDEHGHLIGDEVLRALAADLRTRVRRTDLVGRYGGEEFLLLLPDTPRQAAHALLDELRAHVARPRRELPTFTLSAGIAEAPIDGASLEALLAAADRRLYAAKHAGRNRVVSEPPASAAHSP